MLRCVVLVLDGLRSQTGQPGLVVARKLLEQGFSLRLLVLKLIIVSVDALKLFVEMFTGTIGYG